MSLKRDEQRKKATERMRKWRSNPENLARQNKRRKEIREQNKDAIKKKEHEYYLKNREHILKRCKEYHTKNRDVRKRYQKKFVQSGKSIDKGRRDRTNLTNAYIASQIRKEKSNKTIEQKQAEILIYRIKKQIKRYE